MTTPTTCYPWWHAEFEPLRHATQITVSSGCYVNSSGNIPCEPEAMRAAAEAKMAQYGHEGSLSLTAYTLARYMQGEVGSGTIEERVAVGEAAVGRAKLERKTVLDILLYRQPNHLYGQINVPAYGGQNINGRWASTSADPTVLNILLAKFILDGNSANFANRADDQDGIEYAKYFPDIPAYVRNLARNGKFWVGPLPGVNHWRTFLQTTIRGETDQTALGASLVQQTLETLGPQIASRSMPAWPADLPVCAKGASNASLVLTAFAGAALGVWALTSRWFRKVGQAL